MFKLCPQNRHSSSHLITPMNKTAIPLDNCPLCKNEPCRHSDALCFDEDYLADLDTDRDLWRKIRAFYYHPSDRAKSGLEIAKYQDNLGRSQRRDGKRKQIEAEIEAN